MASYIAMVFHHTTRLRPLENSAPPPMLDPTPRRRKTEYGEDHKLVIDKQIKPTTNDKEVIDITPLAAIAANRRTEDGNGNPV